MTRDEAVAAIQLQLGFRTDLTATIILCLKQAQQQLELQPIKPWFLVSEDAYRRTEADEERLPVPSDFLEEVETARMYYVPDDADGVEDHVELIKDDYDLLKKNFLDTESGPPEAYAILGGYFRLFPVPDDDYLIRMIYYAEDTVLDTNVENGWLKNAPYLLMGKAGQLVAGATRDKAAVEIFQNWEAQGMLGLNSKNVSREMANRSLQMGGSH